MSSSTSPSAPPQVLAPTAPALDVRCLVTPSGKRVGLILINLRERADRRREFFGQFNRPEAHEFRDRVSVFDAVRPDGPGGFRSIGMRGCFTSHLRVLALAEDLGLDILLVMEDDLDVEPGFWASFDQVLAQLDRDDWDLLYLGHTLDDVRPREGGLRFEPYHKHILRTHFYAMRREPAAELSRFLELVQSRPAGHPDGGPMSIDGAFWTFREQHPHIRTVVANPSLGSQRSSASDITPGRFDRIPLTAPLLAGARRVKRALKHRRH